MKLKHNTNTWVQTAAFNITYSCTIIHFTDVIDIIVTIAVCNMTLCWQGRGAKVYMTTWLPRNYSTCSRHAVLLYHNLSLFSKSKWYLIAYIAKFKLRDWKKCQFWTSQRQRHFLWKYYDSLYLYEAWVNCNKILFSAEKF